MLKKKKKLILIIIIALLIIIALAFYIYKNSIYSLEKVESLLNAEKEATNLHIKSEYLYEEGEEERIAYVDEYIKDNIIYAVTKNYLSQVLAETLANMENSELITILHSEKVITSNIISENENASELHGNETFFILVGKNAKYKCHGKEDINEKKCLKVSLTMEYSDKIEKNYFYINLEDNYIVKHEIYEESNENELEKIYDVMYSYSYNTVTDNDILNFDISNYPDYEYFE